MEGRQRTVLMVDDDPELCELLPLSLREVGFEVLVVSDTAGTLRALSGRWPDCVIINIQLPDVNCFDLFDTIKQAGPSTPVLFLSAPLEEEVIKKAKAFGVTDFIPIQPFEIEHIVDSVQRHCRLGFSCPQQSRG